MKHINNLSLYFIRSMPVVGRWDADCECEHGLGRYDATSSGSDESSNSGDGSLSCIELQTCTNMCNIVTNSILCTVTHALPSKVCSRQ